MSTLLEADGGLPPSFKVCRAERDAGRDVNWWFHAQVAPAEIPRLKASVVKSSKDAVDHKADASVLPVGAVPDWWNPQSLPDPDVIVVGHRYYVFSNVTGDLFICELD
jgi:hypothetical protein